MNRTKTDAKDKTVTIDQGELQRLLDKQAIKELKHKYLRLCCEASSPDENGKLYDMEGVREIYTNPMRVTSGPGGISRVVVTHDQLVKGYVAMLTRFTAQVMHATSFEFHFDDDDTCRTRCLNYAIERSVHWPSIPDAISDVIYEDTFVRTPEGWRQSEMQVLHVFEEGGPGPGAGDPRRVAEDSGRPEWSKRLRTEAPWRATPAEVAAETAPENKSYKVGDPIVLTGTVTCMQHDTQDEVIGGNTFRSCSQSGDGRACTWKYV